ncbi:MAG: serine hydrolase [Candidatus Taylorbacteria bacterium]
MNVHRKIIITFTTCITIIGILAGIRTIQYSTDSSIHAPIVIPTSTENKQTTDQPALTYEGSFVSTSTRTTSSAPTSVGPHISAKAYLVGDLITGKIYIEHDAHAVLPVASMSKLITAIAITDNVASSTRITIQPDNTNVATDTSMIGAGETFTVHELLYPLLLNSSNIVAEALASSTDRNAFLELMKGYAWEVGASTAFFADPSGLNPLNSASAYDMFALAQYLYNSRPDILAITRIASTTIATTTDHGSHDFVSTHPFVLDPRFIGGKTGRTLEAHETMMTLLNIDSHPIAFIVLASDYGARARDTHILIDKVMSLIH